MKNLGFSLIIISASMSAFSQQTTSSVRAGGWDAKDITNELDGSIQTLIFKTGSNCNNDCSIGIKCSQAQPELILNLGEIPQYEQSGASQRSRVRFRFDEDPVITDFLQLSTDHRALFMDSPKRDLMILQTKQTLRIEYRAFEAGLVTLRFDLRGLSEAIEPYLYTCGIAPKRKHKKHK